MEFEMKSKVYIQTDDSGRILRCEGGYTTPADLTDWTYIDEGYGDRYNLAQSHYFEGGLCTMDGIPRYRWDGARVILRSEDELEADRAAAVDLDALKAERVVQSKTALAEYLEGHPLTWTDGNQYSVTAEKQSLLTSQIALYQTAAAAGQAYTLHWNTTGGVCTEWTISDLSALALAIGAYVQPLVSYQQAKEVAIRACETAEALAAIEVDYETLS